MLLLPLDDLLAVAREFLNPDVSRSGLDRCLRRHGVSNLNALRPKTPAEPHKTFKTYEPGFLHVDVKYLPQMADETTRPLSAPLGECSHSPADQRIAAHHLPGNGYLFVAIDPLPPSRACKHALPGNGQVMRCSTERGGDPLGLHPHLQLQDRRQRPPVASRTWKGPARSTSGRC